MTGNRQIQVILKYQPFVDDLNGFEMSLCIPAMTILMNEVNGAPSDVFYKKFNVLDVQSFPRPAGAKIIQFTLLIHSTGALKCTALMRDIIVIPIVCEIIPLASPS
jgi:hypothetical protein